MTTIQDNIKEILCEFVSFNAIEDENGGRQKIKFLGESRPLIDKLEQFLIQSIKLVQEETRKEVEEFILNRDNCSLVKQTATINNGVVNTYLYDGDLILKSITNKEIKK